MVIVSKKITKSSVKKTPLKKTESKELTKQRLLTSALEIFCEYGFDAATTRLISDHSGVNESLINRYFEGKKGLFDAVLKEYFRTKQKLTDQYASGETIREEIENFLIAVFQEYTQNLQILRMIRTRASIDKNFKEATRNNIEYPNKKLDKAIRQFQKKKIIRTDLDTAIFHEMIYFFVTGMIDDKSTWHLAKEDIYKVINNAALAFEKFAINPNLKAEKKKS